MIDQMDETVETYKQFFRKFIEGTKDIDKPNDVIRSWMERFMSYLPPEGEIIEIGSAYGRDASFMHAHGFRVLCTDVAETAIYELEHRGLPAHLYDVRKPPLIEWTDRFDGYFANAVLLHLSEEAFLGALRSAYIMLRRGGVATFSLKIGEGEEMTTRKMDAPRYFKYYDKDELIALLPKTPFDTIDVTVSSDGGWLIAFLRKR